MALLRHLLLAESTDTETSEPNREETAGRRWLGMLVNTRLSPRHGCYVAQGVWARPRHRPMP